MMQPACGGGIADGFADRHRERNDVVLYARFNFIYARDIYFRALTNQRGGFARHLPRFGEGFRRGKLNVQPLLKAIRIAPNAAHFFTRVTWNQNALLGA